MILFPHCKINLGLRVLSRRPDGYHDLETVFYPVRGLCDALEVVPAAGEGVKFSASGLPVDAKPGGNLCEKAYAAVQRRYPIGGVRMHLHKVIPAGSGLGGGSADAAFTIRLLSEVFELDLSVEEMEAIAAEVGSDAPFFVTGRPAAATGRGERLAPLDFSLRGYRLVIVKPPFSVSTREAFARVTPRKRGDDLADLVRQPVAAWRSAVTNDFETSLFPQHPRLAELKAALYDAGADYASLSGSGSALFGLFPAGSAVDLSLPDDTFVYQEDIG